MQATPGGIELLLSRRIASCIRFQVTATMPGWRAVPRVRVALARGRQPMGDNYVRPLPARKFCGSMSKYRFNLQARRRTSIRRRHSPGRPQIHSPVPSGRSTCASRSFCAARAAAQPCSICSLTAAHRPLGTRGCILGARRCRPVRAGVQAGASGVAGGSSVCSPIS